MIKLEPKERLTIPQILTHSWLKETNEMGSESEENEEEDCEKNSQKNSKNGGSAANSKENEDKKKGGEEEKPQNNETAKDKDGKPVDMNQIQGNVNYVNVDNLFYYANYKTKLSYIDYCCITEDFSSQLIDEEALKVCENFGFPR